MCPGLTILYYKNYAMLSTIIIIIIILRLLMTIIMLLKKYIIILYNYNFNCLSLIYVYQVNLTDELPISLSSTT